MLWLLFSCSNIFCSDTDTGEIYEKGDNMTWPHMEETLQGIADEGPDYIYNARRTYTLVDEIKEVGQCMTFYIGNKQVLIGKRWRTYELKYDKSVGIELVCVSCSLINM